MKKIMASLLAFAFLACVGMVAFAAGDTGAGVVVYKDVDVEFSFYSIMNLSDDAVTSPEATYTYTLTAVEVTTGEEETIYGLETATGVLPDGDVGSEMMPYTLTPADSTNDNSLTAQAVFTTADYANSNGIVGKSVSFEFTAEFSDAGVYHYRITETKESGNSYITDDPNTTRDVYLVIGWADVTEDENPYLELKSVLMYDTTYAEAHKDPETATKSTGYTHSYGVVPETTASTDEDGVTTYIYSPGEAGSQGQDFVIDLTGYGDLVSYDQEFLITVTAGDGYSPADGTTYKVEVDGDDDFEWQEYSEAVYSPIYDLYIWNDAPSVSEICYMDGTWYSYLPYYQSWEGSYWEGDENYEVGEWISTGIWYGYWTGESYAYQEGFSFTLTAGQSCTIYSVGAGSNFKVSIEPITSEDEGYTFYARNYQWGDAETTNVDDDYSDIPTTGYNNSLFATEGFVELVILNNIESSAAITTNWYSTQTDSLGNNTYLSNAKQGSVFAEWFPWSTSEFMGVEIDSYIYAVEETDGTYNWYQDNEGISFAIVRGDDIDQGDDDGITYTPFTNTGITLEIIPFACMALFAGACITLRITHKSQKKRGTT